MDGGVTQELTIALAVEKVLFRLALLEGGAVPVVRAFLPQNLRRSSEPTGWAWQPNLEVIDRRLDAITGWPAEDLAGVAPYDGPVVWVRGE